MKRRTWDDLKNLALGRIVRTQLKKHDQNITHAARAMGIERGHMQRLMKRYGVERESC